MSLVTDVSRSMLHTHKYVICTTFGFVRCLFESGWLAVADLLDTIVCVSEYALKNCFTFFLFIYIYIYIYKLYIIKTIYIFLISSKTQRVVYYETFMPTCYDNILCASRATLTRNCSIFLFFISFCTVLCSHDLKNLFFRFLLLLLLLFLLTLCLLRFLWLWFIVAIYIHRTARTL